MKPCVLVIGSTNTDMILKVPHLPAPGETILGGEFSIVQGGKGANQAVAAARAGGNVSFVSCIGNDLFGKKSIEELTKEGIDVSAIKIINGYPSGVALINVSETGENSISVAPGANNQLFPEDIDKLEQLFRKAGIVLVQLEIPLETVKKVLQTAKKYQVQTILNPAPARKLGADILSLIDILTPNEKEAFMISGMQNPETDYTALSNALKKLGTKNAVITLGENGVFYTNDYEYEHIPGHKVIPIDTTAAGDTFNGYLATALARGDKINSALKLANKAASLSVTRLGAQPSIPYLTELEESANI